MRAPVLLVALALLAGCADLDKLATVIPSPDAGGDTRVISPNGGFISTNGGGIGSTPVNALVPGAAASTAPEPSPSTTPSASP